LDKQFVDKPTQPNELEKDHSNYMNTIEFQYNFIGLLIQTYQESKMKELPIPEICSTFKKVWVAQEMGVIKLFLENFEFTDKTEDSVKSADIDEWVTMKKIKMKKLTMELND
jgi:hypothetical protein